MSGEAARSSTH